MSQKYKMRALFLEVIRLVMPLVDAERSRMSVMAEEKLGGKLSCYLKKKEKVLDSVG